MAGRSRAFAPVFRSGLVKQIFCLDKYISQSNAHFPEFDFNKNFWYNNYRKIKKGVSALSIELVKALITIVKHCVDCGNCAECPMRDFCGHIPSEW